MGSSRLVRRSTVLPTALVLLAAGGGLAWANTGATVSRYRTAVVTTGDVEQLLTVTGTVQNVDQTKVSFPVSGIVTTVSAQVGATVTKGQQLATTDTAPLQDAVVAATASLDKAKATLETDSASTSATSATSSSTSTSSAPATSSAARTTAATPTKTGPTSSGSSSLLADAQKALDAATRACGSSPSAAPGRGSSPPSPTASPSGDGTTASPSPSPSTSPSPSPSSPVGPAGAAAGSDCAAALTAALAAQQKVGAAQAALQRTLQTSSTGQAGSTGTSTGSQATTPTSAASSSTTRSGSGTSGGASTTATGGQSQASRITVDQAAVDAAAVALAVADSNLTGATLTSPVAGKVASQPFVVGASSGTSSIVIVAPGAVQVTGSVPATSVPLVKVGQPATITPDGSTTALTGRVAAVGLLPTTSTSGSTTTYPVQVLVTQPASLAEGAAASVSITVKTVHAVLTVPNSALSDGAVTVLSQGKTSTTRVQTGAVGALTTEITSGLTAGQQVVLADLNATLPANSTTTRGFGGTGGPPGGFTGGGAGGGQGVRPGG